MEQLLKEAFALMGIMSIQRAKVDALESEFNELNEKYEELLTMN